MEVLKRVKPSTEIKEEKEEEMIATDAEVHLARQLCLSGLPLLGIQIENSWTAHQSYNGFF
jgi:hypothetical protein